MPRARDSTRNARSPRTPPAHSARSPAAPPDRRTAPPTAAVAGAGRPPPPRSPAVAPTATSPRRAAPTWARAGSASRSRCRGRGRRACREAAVSHQTSASHRASSSSKTSVTSPSPPAGVRPRARPTPRCAPATAARRPAPPRTAGSAAGTGTTGAAVSCQPSAVRCQQGHEEEPGERRLGPRAEPVEQIPLEGVPAVAEVLELHRATIARTAGCREPSAVGRQRERNVSRRPATIALLGSPSVGLPCDRTLRGASMPVTAK